MTNTINNVPRELLAELQEHIHCHHDAVLWGKVCDLLSATSPANHVEDVRAMVAAPSPAGVDGLNTDRNAAFKACPESGCDWGSFYLGWKARGEVEQAIIDGLRGEVASQEETANQWRELALQFDRHRMTAMAHIRAAASGDKSAIEALGVFAALPPIPGHEITAERDQHAQRIGELEGLLREVRLPDDIGRIDIWTRIDAALSAGKDSVS